MNHDIQAEVQSLAVVGYEGFPSIAARPSIAPIQRAMSATIGPTTSAETQVVLVTQVQMQRLRCVAFMHVCSVAI